MMQRNTPSLWPAFKIRICKLKLLIIQGNIFYFKDDTSGLLKKIEKLKIGLLGKDGGRTKLWTQIDWSSLTKAYVSV